MYLTCVEYVTFKFSQYIYYSCTLQVDEKYMYVEVHTCCIVHC